MKKSKKVKDLERLRKISIESTPDQSQSPKIVAHQGTSGHKVLEATISAAKERIKAKGLFPTTSRLVEETGYTPTEINTYFEGRLLTRAGKRPLLAKIGYLPSANSPLSEGKPLPKIPDYTRPRCFPQQ